MKRFLFTFLSFNQNINFSQKKANEKLQICKL